MDCSPFSEREKDTRCEAQYKQWNTRILDLTLPQFFWYTDLKHSVPQFPLT